MSRWLALGLLFAACKEDPPPPAETPEDTAPVLPDVPCASWEDDLRCIGAGAGCYAECSVPRQGKLLTIDCDGRQCFLQGVGQGAGRSCTISDDDRADQCGFCRTAHRECYLGL